MQDWTDDCYNSGHAGQVDLANMEKNFQAVKSLWSGNSSPANPTAGMPWYDLAHRLLRLRNYANNGWHGLMHGDAAQKMWVYRNSAMDGWVVDSSVADRVLAIRGGSRAYNIAGGSAGGTWQQAGHTLNIPEIPAHGHDASTNKTGSHSHETGFGRKTSENQGPLRAPNGTDSDIPQRTTPAGEHAHTVTINPTGGGKPHNHGSTWRPAAAVGTLQRLNV